MWCKKVIEKRTHGKRRNFLVENPFPNKVRILFIIDDNSLKVETVIQYWLTKYIFAITKIQEHRRKLDNNKHTY